MLHDLSHSSDIATGLVFHTGACVAQMRNFLGIFFAILVEGGYMPVRLRGRGLGGATSGRCRASTGRRCTTKTTLRPRA